MNEREARYVTELLYENKQLKTGNEQLKKSFDDLSHERDELKRHLDFLVHQLVLIDRDADKLI